MAEWYKHHDIQETLAKFLGTSSSMEAPNACEWERLVMSSQRLSGSKDAAAKICMASTGDCVTRGTLPVHCEQCT